MEAIAIILTCSLMGHQAIEENCDFNSLIIDIFHSTRNEAIPEIGQIRSLLFSVSNLIRFLKWNRFENVQRELKIVIFKNSTNNPQRNTISNYLT